jgi:carboxyl-terminal processing protease
MDNTETTHVTRGVRIFGGIVVLAAVFFGGVYIGYQNRSATDKITSVIHKESPVTATTDFDPFWKAWTIVDKKFAGADAVSNEDRMYGAIKGMLASFDDPYTTFFPPSENALFESEISGTFNGIGIELGEKDDTLTVIAPLKDTPADRAGIKSGDKIVKIDDTMTNDISIDKAITLIRGKAGTSVALTIVREGLAVPKVIEVTREQISLPTVETEARPEHKAFIIHLYNFSAQSPQLFRNALDEYLASGYPNLLLDLRGNPGGYLEAAVTMAGWFIPEGKVVVKEIGKDPADVSVLTSKGPTLFPSKSKLIILVDQGSASASEILAGALSEQGIGVLVGEQTYGKGSVQEVIKLTDNTSLKITVAKWYTPNGVSISDSGLTPVVKIPYTNDDKDAQLETALGLFLK